MNDSFSIPSHNTSSFPSAIMHSSESIEPPLSSSLSLSQPHPQPLPSHETITVMRDKTEVKDTFSTEGNNQYQHMFDRRAQNNINSFKAAVKHDNQLNSVFHNFITNGNNNSSKNNKISINGNSIGGNRNQAPYKTNANHTNHSTNGNNDSYFHYLQNSNKTNDNYDSNNNGEEGIGSTTNALTTTTTTNNTSSNTNGASSNINSNNSNNNSSSSSGNIGYASSHESHDFNGKAMSQVSSQTSGHDSNSNFTHHTPDNNEASSFNTNNFSNVMEENNSNSSFNSVQRFSAAEQIRVEKSKKIVAQWYPLYHLAAPGGWMGVPGGLCFFKGYYHVFYQYNPFDENWGLMHWGHAISENLVHWRQCAIALVPGNDWDRDGCFSGTAVVHEDKMYLFYTGHRWVSMDSADDIYQQQCLAVSEDGLHFSKLGVVVRPPPGYLHFRDPRVWFEGNMWWMVCGARSVGNDLGQLIMYSSPSLTEWNDSQFAVLLKSEDKNVFMWECPDFFRLKDKHVLMFSPQGMHSAQYDRRNRFHSGYIVGEWAPFMHFKPCEPFVELDRGHDLYAPQTFLAQDGRRMMIGWLDMWGNPRPSKAHNWSGVLTLPRELCYDAASGKIKIKPPRELELLRRAHATIPPETLAENAELPLVEDCTMYEVEFTLNVQISTADKYGLWLGNGVELFVDAQCDRLVLNRHFPQHMLSGYRSCAITLRPLLKLRVYIDRTSIEVFVNDGEETFTSRIYPEPHDRALRLFSLNGTAVITEGNVWLLQKAVE